MVKHPEASVDDIFKSVSGASVNNQSMNSETIFSKDVLADINTDGTKSEKLTVDENKIEEGDDKRRVTALENPRVCLFSNKQFPGIK